VPLGLRRSLPGREGGVGTLARGNYMNEIPEVGNAGILRKTAYFRGG
jgi:hypothetical protein